jgi:hypothetical protein
MSLQESRFKIWFMLLGGYLMGQLEFIRNKVIKDIIPRLSKVRIHIYSRRWPTIIRIKRHITCPTNKYGIVGSGTKCETCDKKIAYMAGCGSLYCSRLDWRLINE